MKLTEEQIQHYAKKYANQYLAKYGESLFVDRDDAYAIALEALWTKNEYDDTRSPAEVESFIRKRVIGAIKRAYQTMNNTRRKERPVFVSLDEIETEFAKKERNFGDKYLDTAIEKALQNLNSRREVEIIESLLSGLSQAEVAILYNVSVGRVSQVFSLFKRLARRMLFVEGNKVIIIDTRGQKPTEQERLEMPLFF